MKFPSENISLANTLISGYADWQLNKQCMNKRIMNSPLIAGRKQAVCPLALLTALWVLLLPRLSTADVPSGDPQSATNYYRHLATNLDFSTADLIFQTKLDDVATYLGYDGVTGSDLQNLPPDVLMHAQSNLGGTNSPYQHPDRVATAIGTTPFSSNEILVTRFFAPKIMNIHDPESVRKIGWRKLIRLRARPGSRAAAHHIGYGIVLFNIATPPGAVPFSPTDESKNTQVMLVTELGSVPPPNTPGPPTIYWLDYRSFSDQEGILSLALDQTFDANELPPALNGTKSYYVPDGCVACHGGNPRRAMVNYLDTDHWFDRLENDFPNLKASSLPLLFDANTNETTSPAYKSAFDVIAIFNAEADAEVKKAQPQHDEALASAKWLEIHATNYSHVQPTDRAIGNDPRWSPNDTNEVRILSSLNQYCFRCHGTVKFSVFNKEEIRRPEFRALLNQAVRNDTPLLLRMPPDRDLPDDIRNLILQFTQQP
ncbi:MAG TPA: hypothetical protein VFC44_18380 [Candidatus Saccharimonadales bacterium]|nr:hypothetical protein [Candidatus Saccharimonadales bacterium]